MASRTKLGLLLLMLLTGCTSHQVTQHTAAPAAPYTTLQVRVQFDTPEHAAYLAAQLVRLLARHGVNATIAPADARPGITPLATSALLQLHLTDAWTDTFISTRQMPRRSLTQMRGRIPRESPRFSTQAELVDRQSGDTLWQADTITAGAWYSDFTTNADSLVARLVKQLTAQGLMQTELFNPAMSMQ
jgi:hypothetical protein